MVAAGGKKKSLCKSRRTNGAIKPRKTTTTTVKLGRPPEPMSAWHGRQLESARKHEAEMEARKSIDSCIWRRSKYGGLNDKHLSYDCCSDKACVAHYAQGDSLQERSIIIRLLRTRYLNTLSTSGVRVWLKQPIDFCGFARESHGITRRPGEKERQYSLEPRGLLWTRLMEALRGQKEMSPPRPSELRQCCVRMFKYTQFNISPTLSYTHSVSCCLFYYRFVCSVSLP